MITSVQNPRVQFCRKLRERKHREESGMYVIDGWVCVQRALDAGQRIRTLFHHFAKPHIEGETFVAKCAQSGIECLAVSAAVFKKIAYGAIDSGLVAVAEAGSQSLAAFAPSAKGLYLILDHVEKPGNIGALLRTADAAGVTGLFLSDPLTDLWNPNMIRASLGTCFTVPFFAGSATAIQEALNAVPVRYFILVPEGGISYLEQDYRGPVAFIAGNEHSGLSPHWQSAKAQPLTIPMRGQADSLNVSVAMTVVLFEALRQRKL